MTREQLLAALPDEDRGLIEAAEQLDADVELLLRRLRAAARVPAADHVTAGGRERERQVRAWRNAFQAGIDQLNAGIKRCHARGIHFLGSEREEQKALILIAQGEELVRGLDAALGRLAQRGGHGE